MTPTAPTWPDRRDRILANLRRTVPPAPTPKPVGSFAGLRPGQRLCEPGSATVRTVATVARTGATLDSGTVLGRDWADLGYHRAGRRKPTQKETTS